jgi:hypothetical protein
MGNHYNGISYFTIKLFIMKEWIAKYQKAIVGTGAVSVLLICFLQQKELARLRSEPKIEVYTGGDIQKGQLIDSLRNEDFIKGTIITRYEITLEHLKETNPKAAKEFEDWMSQNTE